jgi:hypothetical protein
MLIMDNIQSFTSPIQMNDPEDDTMDSYSGYSDTERYENYMEIVKALKFLENNGHITEDWMEEHRWLIEKWRDWVSNYCDINPEVRDKGFRKACNDTETLISYLIRSIRTTKTFDIKVYCILLTKMKYICDTLFDQYELEQMMGQMNMS